MGSVLTRLYGRGLKDVTGVQWTDLAKQPGGGVGVLGPGLCG